ncbi:MAG: DUF4129 domain-containing protein [Candidatus Pristimantibacillus sp.]
MNLLWLQKPSITALYKGAIEVLFFLPLLLTAAVYSLPSSLVPVWLLTLPFCYIAGLLMISMVKQNRRIYRVLLSLAGGMVHSGILILLAGGVGVGIFYWLLLFILSSLAVSRGIRLLSESWDSVFPNALMIYSIIIYVIIQPLKIPLSKLAPYGLWLTICGILAVITCFFLINERLLDGETSTTDNKRIVKSVTAAAFKRQNRWMVGVIVFVLCLISLFRILFHTIEELVQSIITTVMSWLNRPAAEEVIEPPINEPPEPALPIAVEPKDPAVWMLILEAILKYIGIGLVVIVGLLLIFFIGRTLIRTLRKVFHQMLERANEKRSADEGYTDEVESLMSLTKWSDDWKKSMRRFIRGKEQNDVRWNELKTNGERIRFLYTRLLSSHIHKGYTHHRHLTPQETISDLTVWRKQQKPAAEEQTLIRVYEEVRYGDQQPDDQMVTTLKKKLDEAK